jgi:hypothetical protein
MIPSRAGKQAGGRGRGGVGGGMLVCIHYTRTHQHDARVRGKEERGNIWTHIGELPDVSKVDEGVHNGSHIHDIGCTCWYSYS